MNIRLIDNFIFKFPSFSSSWRKVAKEKGEDIKDDDTSETSNDGMFEEAVDQLLSYSFVSLRKDKTSFKMHGLVQLATRKWLVMHKEDEK
jgi:hypothetical protein